MRSSSLMALVATLAVAACSVRVNSSEDDTSTGPTGGTTDAGASGDGASFPDAYSPDDISAYRPVRRELTEERLRSLTLPAGFRISAYATQMGNARTMAVRSDGFVYVARPLSNDVLLVKPAADFSRASETVVVATGVAGAHGADLYDNELFVATVKEVYAFPLNADGTLGTRRVVTTGLPDGGQHPKRTLHVGPDGYLYVSVGSSCDACAETNPEHATMLRMKVDGSERTVFARGLRNTIGFSWHPVTSELWGMDQGSDSRGNDVPPEELNRIVPGKSYGWPYAFADRKIDPLLDDPPGSTKEAFAASSEPPVLTYQAHSSPIELLFYSGPQFPAEYRNDAFVTLRGSWNRVPPTGYKIVRVHFENGQPTRFDDFVSGWLVEEGRAQFGRVAGLAQLPDGSLLVSEDENGVIYRIVYTGT